MTNTRPKLCGLIGCPVWHSLSPAIHNAAFAHLELNYTYLSFDVSRANLEKALNNVRELDMAGINVTIPYKTAVLPLLDELDPLAQDIGAVNTVVNQNGILKGYNTDAAGFTESLRIAGFDARNEHILLLGAGGVAHAISFALARQGAHITILSRHTSLKQALSLSQNLNRFTRYPVKVSELTGTNLKNGMICAGLLVNATSAGMTPNDTETPLSTELLKPEIVVFDAVYTPLETRLLREAHALGCQTISGLDMLIHQGAQAFKLWTGKEAPLDIMRCAALKGLGITQSIKTNSEPHSAKSSVALIGFMGCGKSSVGRALACEIGKPFIDIDQNIEQKSGTSVAQIFARDGESAFRALEKSVTRTASANANKVIACGGGVVLDTENIANLKRHAVIIYLKSNTDAIKQRLSVDTRRRRPLLSGVRWRNAVDTLMAEREMFYSQAADIIIDNSTTDIATTVKLIMQKLREHESFNF